MKFLKLLFIVSIMAGCSKATESFVEGYWELTKGSINNAAPPTEFRIQFFEDNTGRWGASYYTMDSINWSFDKGSQVIRIEEMKADSVLELEIVEKSKNSMQCVSKDTNEIILYFNRL